MKSNQKLIDDFYEHKVRVKKISDEKYRKRFARKIEGGIDWLEKLERREKLIRGGEK